jgi:hypothetical protein
MTRDLLDGDVGKPGLIEDFAGGFGPGEVGLIWDVRVFAVGGAQPDLRVMPTAILNRKKRIRTEINESVL